MTEMTGRSAAIRVLVADDHPVFRDGLSADLARHPEIEVVSVAHDGAQALAELRRLDPDVAVLDLQLPGMDGIGLIEAAARDGLHTRCIILSAFEDPETVFRAFVSGAAAYLMKIVSAQAVAEAVVAVAQGQSVIPPELQGGLTAQLRKWHSSSPDNIRLTERELDVLRLAADGMAIKAIADEIFVGVTTVKTHLQRVYEKLGVNDRAGAVAAAMRRGLLE